MVHVLPVPALASIRREPCSGNTSALRAIALLLILHLPDPADISSLLHPAMPAAARIDARRYRHTRAAVPVRRIRARAAPDTDRPPRPSVRSRHHRPRGHPAGLAAPVPSCRRWAKAGSYSRATGRPAVPALSVQLASAWVPSAHGHRAQSDVP